MPIITVLVPESAKDEVLNLLRKEVRDALERKGVSRDHVTVEFPVCKSPEHLVINYDSRSERLIETEGRLNHDAQIVGRVVETRLGMPVECIVHYCNESLTGLYLTQVVDKSAECEMHGSIEHMQAINKLCPGCGKP